MNIAIVELRESHEECIYTQLRFLKEAGHRVTLILNSVLERQVADYAHQADEVRYFEMSRSGLFHKIGRQRQLFGILKKFDKLVLNTAHSYSVLRNLTVLLRFSKTECIGVLHDTKKLQGSLTQRIISQKVKKYFVLNDTLLPENQTENRTENNQPKENIDRDIKLQSFYPIFFPDYEPVPVYKQQEIWIGIPGRLDYRRRNYDFLVDALIKIPNLKRVRFLILGKVDRDSPAGFRFYKSLEDAGQLKRFKLFHSFVDNADFHSYLKACDYIMPMLHTDEAYFRYKISGAFNLAFAYKKPLVCHKSFKNIPDLRDNSLFFDPESFPALIEAIDAGTVESPATYTDEKWGYRFQQGRYLDFINE
ncbi:MAG: glycosyltransferase [Pricia sp.]